jgi:hypothetical protein
MCIAFVLLCLSTIAYQGQMPAFGNAGAALKGEGSGTHLAYRTIRKANTSVDDRHRQTSPGRGARREGLVGVQGLHKARSIPHQQFKEEV